MTERPTADDTAGKATPAGGEATLSSVVVDLTLSDGARDLLTAIFEALDVPLPGLDDADERAYHSLMERRISNVRSSLGPILHDLSGGLVSTDARGIRKGTAGNPVTYTEWVSPALPAGGEQA